MSGSASASAVARPRFRLPEALVATEPPEARGLARDGVRLLVARPGELTHARARDLHRFLRAGDLLVVNTSATVPAALSARRDAAEVALHVAGRDEDGGWIVELRASDRSGPLLDGVPGERVELPGGALVTLLRAAEGRRPATAGRSNGAAVTPDGPSGTPGGPAGRTRLWHALPQGAGEGDGALIAYLRAHGRPITYAYLSGTPPLRDFQTVFATHPGSAEMPSAGRPLSTRLLADLVAAGVVVAPITLHTGVSSPDAGEPPQREWFRVPATTARLVGMTRAGGGRVVAVGTTVTRAVESAARRDGSVAPATGWTDLVLGSDRPARVVDGLLTGWHAPEASHLDLLEAVAGADLVADAYDAALAAGYLWHEFGDSCLLLPEAGRRAA